MIRIKNPLHARVGKHIIKIVRNPRLKLIIPIALGFFIAINVVTAAVYQTRLYPNSFISGQALGNTSYKELQKLPRNSDNIIAKTNYAQKTLPRAKLGRQIDWQATIKEIKKRKPILPFMGLFGRKSYNLQFKSNATDFAATTKQLVEYFGREPKDWSIDTSSGSAKLVTGSAGYRVNTEKIAQNLQQTYLMRYFEVPISTVQPKVSNAQLQPLVDKLTAKQNVRLVFTYNGTIRQPNKKDILSWYDISTTGISLNTSRLSSYISGLGTGLGIRVKNLSELTTSTNNALSKQTTLQANIIAAPKATKQYSFCVRAKNVPETELSSFAAKLLSTLNDSRGWSLDGQVTFVQTSSGCNMIAWLSAASDMSSFGTICDSLWSCTVYPNVIINYDRWRYASEAWNASGGSLDDYRSMVINHESGHWLGFGHRYCGGAGQLAPVMQQQSISLQGCSFNPWPNANEKDSLRAKLGL